MTEQLRSRRWSYARIWQTPFINIFNEFYAKETSRKIKAVFNAKGNSGKPLTTNPPYGYLKDPEDKNTG